MESSIERVTVDFRGGQVPILAGNERNDGRGKMFTGLDFS